ncbi:MAG: dihydroorotate dehydrogenase electron transfer subunit [Solirubrobacteraceae bacterium]|jgi:NAD(P)H-flavin reductase|nr:dihydroorotate dehydrogenase electron transfer subunit [Solirubrobacteraceae bacterium]
MRTLAPFGRRRVAVTGADDVGAYRILHADDPDGPRPWPGQFYMLASVERWGAGEDERPFLPRAFSFLRAVDGRLSFMLEDVGPGTRRLAELAAGDELWITGPLGCGFSAPPDAERAILAGGGVGIPPLAAWAIELSAAAVPTTAVLGFRDAHHAAGAALLDAAPVEVATDDGSVGHPGLVTDLLADALSADAAATVYACGPPAMLEAVRALCEARGVAAQLALEAGMACGFGACFGCVVAVREGGYARVCVDGPVIDAARLEAVPAH